MTEQDLARPVIEIRDFETHNLEYEIYTFGEENVIIPVSKKTTKLGIEKLAEDRIRDIFKKYDPRAVVEVVSGNSVKVKVAKQYIPSVIGRGGSNIKDLERELKVHIDVVEKDSNHTSTKGMPYSFSESKTSLVFTIGNEYVGEHADVFVNDKYITSYRVGRKGQIKIPKRSDRARTLMKLASSQDDIQISLKDF